MIDYRLYLVTDDPSRYKGDWIENVVASVEGGVTCVQYRDTESAPDERLVRVRKLQDALKRFGTPVVVNNDAELAAAVKAEGVHVGQSDMPPAQVRAIVGKDCEIGLSITDIAQIDSIDRSCVDCLGIGPVFDARKTKADASDAMGVDGLGEVIKVKVRGEGEQWNVPNSSTHYPLPTTHYPLPTTLCPLPSTLHPLPTVAIGGITLQNAAEILASGVGGLAVVSAFSKADDPFAVARAFKRLLDVGCLKFEV